MHPLHALPDLRVIAAPSGRALKQLRGADQEKQTHEEQPKKDHRIQPPEARLQEPAPELKTDYQIKARQSCEQHCETRLRLEAALDCTKGSARIAYITRAQGRQKHCGHQRKAVYNAGLALWIVLNFFPIGWAQLDAVYEHGLA